MTQTIAQALDTRKGEHELIFKSLYDVPIETLFGWHQRKGAFARLMPPWQNIKVISHPDSIEEGEEVHLKLGLFNWKLRHTVYRPPFQFTDEQISGPFAYWRHDHLFERWSALQSELTDRIFFKLPFSNLLDPLALSFVKKELTRVFQFRHQRLAHELGLITAYPCPPFLFSVEGKDQLLVRELSTFLLTAGHSTSDEPDVRVTIQNGMVTIEHSNGCVHQIAYPFVLHPMREPLKSVMRAASIGGALKTHLDSWITPDRFAYALYPYLIQKDSPEKGIIVSGKDDELSEALFKVLGKRKLFSASKTIPKSNGESNLISVPYPTSNLEEALREILGLST